MKKMCSRVRLMGTADSLGAPGWRRGYTVMRASLESGRIWGVVAISTGFAWGQSLDFCVR